MWPLSGVKVMSYVQHLHSFLLSQQNEQHGYGHFIHSAYTSQVQAAATLNSGYSKQCLLLVRIFFVQIALRTSYVRVGALAQGVFTYARIGLIHLHFGKFHFKIFKNLVERFIFCIKQTRFFLMSCMNQINNCVFTLFSSIYINFFGFVHLMYQNLSACALFCLNSLTGVNTQLLIK